MSHSLIGHIDFETYCDISVRVVGAHRYVRHKSFVPLTLSYLLPKEQRAAMREKRRPRVSRWQPYKNKRAYQLGRVTPLPDDLVDYIVDSNCIGAHNSEFEMCVWENWMVHNVPNCPRILRYKWRCTAALAASCGLPRALDKAAMACQLHVRKDPEGTRLLRKFASPRKPTKNNPATRIYPWDEPEEFDKLCRYCDTDVLVEYELHRFLPDMPEEEWRVFYLSTEMNARGIPLDMPAVKTGYRVLQDLELQVKNRVRALTGGINPTQRDKMLEFMNSIGIEIENLQAKTIKDLVTSQGSVLSMLDSRATELLQLRIEGGKASTKKLKKMLEVVCEDHFVRGGFLYWGAHTGRWAGKLIQPQNFTRGSYEPWQYEELFDILMEDSADVLQIWYQWPIDAIAQGMRGFIRAPSGKKFVVCDFSAIEARVLAWLARQQSTLERYERNEDLYKVLAVKIYKLNSVDEVLTWQRKFAKDVFLGCGYQLGGPGFARNCFMRGIVISEEEAQSAVDVYREDNPNVVKYWYEIEDAAIRAAEESATEDNPVVLRDIAFFVDRIWFCIRLPSGRLIRYPYPKVEEYKRKIEYRDKKTGEMKSFSKMTKKLTFKTEIKGQWVRENTYGGKLVENIVQGVARDIMVHSWILAEERGYPAIGTVHDELITLVDEDFGSKHELEEILKVRPKWAKKAPIGAEGWEGTRYRK